MRGGASRDDRDRMEAQEAERAGGAPPRAPPPVTPSPGGGVSAAVVAPRRSHARSVSHGGTAWSSITPDVPYYLYQHQTPLASSSAARHEGHYAQAAGASNPENKTTLVTPLGVGTTAQDPFPPNSSVLMNPSPAASTDYTDLYHTAEGDSDRAHHRSHQRTFSHGQTVDGVTGTHHRGHRRAGSRTDFILPDGHEQREKQRERVKPPVGRTSSFPLGHKRTTSKTESIYTIRENKVPLLQRLMFWKKGPEEQVTRTVVANHVLPPHVASPNAAYPTNKITTTKYTLLTFLPKNIFEQFHRFANIYFLFIVLLNFVPAINAFAKEVAMVPLLFVLGVTAVKDLFEDRRRYNSDKRVNNSTCRVYCSEARRYVRRTWKELRVGDVVHLSCNEAVPADLLLLHSSDPYGLCYIDSCNLDGEANLKQRQAVRGLGMDDCFDVSKLDCLVEISPPTTKIHHFLGSIPVQDRRIPLNENNLLLRSCFVKNTDFVEGLVLYAGCETKVLLNSSGSRYKRSQLERAMNTAVICCIGFLLLMCLVSATGAGIYQSFYEDAALEGIVIPFLPPLYSSSPPSPDGAHSGGVLKSLAESGIPNPTSAAANRLYNSPGWVAFLAFWTFIIIYQVIIPIALYVTIEIIKLLQVYHIHCDPHFYNSATGTTIECRALNITEELGQVQYVFTDKTGTLTENNMVFQRCSINGVDYHHPPAPPPPITAAGGEDAAAEAQAARRGKERDTFLINAQLYDELTNSPSGGATSAPHSSPFSNLHQPSSQAASSLMYCQKAPMAHQDPSASAAAASSTLFCPNTQTQVPQHTNLQQLHHRQRLMDFFLTLALCNTVIVAKSPHKDQMTASGIILPPDDPPTPAPPTPNRFGLPSLPTLRFPPLLTPLPDRPRLNLRALNPFSRPLSPIASSPSASPEVPRRLNPSPNLSCPPIAEVPSIFDTSKEEDESPTSHIEARRELGQAVDDRNGWLEAIDSVCDDGAAASGCVNVSDGSGDVTPSASTVSMSSSIANKCSPFELRVRRTNKNSSCSDRRISDGSSSRGSSSSDTRNETSCLDTSYNNCSSQALAASDLNRLTNNGSDVDSTNFPMTNITLNPLSETHFQSHELAVTNTNEVTGCSNNPSTSVCFSGVSVPITGTSASAGVGGTCATHLNSNSSSSSCRANNTGLVGPMLSTPSICFSSPHGTVSQDLSSCVEEPRSRTIVPPQSLNLPASHFPSLPASTVPQDASQHLGTQPLSSATNIPAWKNQRHSPIIDSDSSLGGGIHTSRRIAETLEGIVRSHDPLSSLPVLGGLPSHSPSLVSDNPNGGARSPYPMLSAEIGGVRGGSAAPTHANLQPIYEAESPDELALVDAAQRYGVRLLRRSLHSSLIDVPGCGLLEFEVLHVFPFDSTRKRMSVMVRHPHNRQIMLYCKGADSAILDNLTHPRDQLEQFRQFRTQQHLHFYSKRGLRTLCVAVRALTEAEYGAWSRDHALAEASVTNREYRLQTSYKKIEKNLVLLGATGIEDRLQPGVPETLAALRQAGVAVWLLTGDKQETAINVAHSAALFSPEMQILKLNARTREQAERTLRLMLDQTAAADSCEETESTLTAATSATDKTCVSTATGGDRGACGASLGPDACGGSMSGTDRGCGEEEGSEGSRERGLVVDGKTLVFILDQRTQLLQPFLALTRRCRSVLISRATPLQKALVVRRAKRALGIVSLAIGDGANDVSMIQTADIGVGISGVEGRQAVMASDFAITRFSHLHRLLFLHGHWCYERLASIILYYFYKNANLALILLWYQLYCCFSGNNFIDQMYLIQFSLTFTSVPPIVVGVYDKDAPSSLLLCEPQLYSVGRGRKVYRHAYFWVNILDAIYQSIIMFFFAVGAHHHSDSGMDEVGITVVHNCLVAQLLHIAIEIKSWTLLHVGSLLLSLAVFYLFGMLYTMTCVSCFGLQSQYWVWPHLLASPRHWFIVLLASVTAVLPRFVYRALQTSLWPTDVQLSVLLHRHHKKGQRQKENQRKHKEQKDEHQGSHSLRNPCSTKDTSHPLAPSCAAAAPAGPAVVAAADTPDDASSVDTCGGPISSSCSAEALLDVTQHHYCNSIDAQSSLLSTSTTLTTLGGEGEGDEDTITITSADGDDVVVVDLQESAA